MWILVSSALDKLYNQVKNIIEKNTVTSCIGEESESHIRIKGIQKNDDSRHGGRILGVLEKRRQKAKF